MTVAAAPVPESYSGANPDEAPLAPPVYSPSLEHEAARRLVAERFREAEEARRPLDEVWLQCIAFVDGKQWHRFNWDTGVLELPKAPNWRVRAVNNLTRPKAAQAIAALVQDIPQLDVEPMSTEERDRYAARTGKQLLEYYHEALGWQDLYTSLARWCVWTGTAFTKSTWDPTEFDYHAVPGAAGIVEDPETGEPMLGTLGQDEEGNAIVLKPSLKGVLSQIGQVSTQFCSPFEIYPQPGAQAWKDVEWVIHAKVRSLEYIKARYPDMAPWIRPEGENSNPGYLERRVSDILDQGNPAAGRHERTAVLLEYWEKPCTQYPRGRLITVCNGIVLRYQDLPYEHLIRRRMLPFTCFVYEPFELRVWGRGLVEDLIPLQRQYNSALSDMFGMLKTSGMPKMLWPRTAGAPPVNPLSQPGQVLLYMPDAAGAAVKPEYWTPPPIPATWMQTLDRIEANMDHVAQRHLVSAGSAPTGVVAGVSIQLLQESDNRAFGPIVGGFHHAISRHGMQALALAKQFYDLQRLGHTIGQEDQRELIAFSASDLPDNADVRAVAASRTPMSRAAKTQQLFDLYDRGILGQPGSPDANRIMLRRLEFGDVEQLYEEQVAVQERQMMQQMQMAQMQAQSQLQQQLAVEQARGQTQLQREAQRGEAQLAAAEMRQQVPQAPTEAALLEGVLG